MKEKEMAALLTQRLEAENRQITYDSKNEKLRVESQSAGKGMTLSLPGICARYEDEKEKAVEEVIYYVEQTLEAMSSPAEDREFERRLFPVIRSTSFTTKTSEGTQLITRPHTAESRIYYALDLGQTYRLVDETFLERHNLTATELDEMARFNLRSLPTQTKEDKVAGNTFYFVNHNDGYDASRLLNQSFVEAMYDKIEGTFVCAIPHQDVLIFADIQNNQGYDILAQMAMHFFTTGTIPITSLPFLYEEGEFRPIFIMPKSKSKPIPDERKD
ncbi:DUF1444 family protein [Pullulanibacillus sp. KACC 23026]|uniref:DUF1444 family protein n=1 Tax=Pullulanibacillus sp. KACC 23026 TaxID=3028315 RepID=UPI0023B17622|nr:DUF1444 family protein [Pullulanibacillus sp. KACC 23026]WEG13863.1 DUF1444 family protein [Pullulanibacillus sp. KACC 23026]